LVLSTLHIDAFFNELVDDFREVMSFNQCPIYRGRLSVLSSRRQHAIHL